ncbi:branched-chain amino acid transaminase [Tenacibaculum sp. SG-28]|uniref:branched-chain amino acid transaminase n=1 Tax=Tenacibaculum sp. SG-28 TaxID=754426 RepID=UPI000CF40DB3|nr:branched-chain amino acid transaminase [Tenacibaculum sp. SG-28]PQJ22931.1 branched-chain-amino-acid transaminase [Tenacibaculum sp. SG-28]
MYYNDKTVIFYNGQFVKANNASMGLYNQTLHYGNGVFEGIRAYATEQGTRIFKPQAHFERLQFGAEVMGIEFKYSVEELTAITYELLQKNNLSNAYIRPLVISGVNMGVFSAKDSDLVIQCWEWGKLMGSKLLRVKTSTFQRPNPKSCVVEAKVTGHYINSILASNEAKKEGFDEALLLDMNDNVAECSGANIFMEKDGKLITPPKGHIMAGITRTTIIELCQQEGIEVVERDFKIEELKTADSAFFTGTAAEVVGLASIDSYTFPQIWEQSLGYRLMKLYKQEVLGLRNKRAVY